MFFSYLFIAVSRQLYLTHYFCVFWEETHIRGPKLKSSLCLVLCPNEPEALQQLQQVHNVLSTSPSKHTTTNVCSFKCTVTAMKEIRPQGF